MRVLCSTTPMEGVFAPVVPLLEALQSRGDEVLVATAPQLIPRVQAAGMAAVPAGPNAPDAAALATTLPEFNEGTQPWRIGAVMFSRVMAPQKLPELRAVADEFRPEVIVHPPVDLAAPLLAAVLGVASVTYGTGLRLEDELIAAMSQWVAPLWQSSGVAPDDHAGLYRYRYLDPIPPSLQSELGPAARVSAPMRPVVPGRVDDPLPDWADGLTGRPVVYVSLGTVPIFNQPAAFSPLIAGLADLDLDVVVTVGTDTDPAALGPQPANVHVEQWLSLAALLPRCAAVLCHGGAGTTLAALSHGLPLVLSPRGADQFATARACHIAGAATVLSADDITPDAVRAAVSTVLEDDSHRDAARRLRSEIIGMPTAAVTAERLLDGVVRR
jgi:UDP:flavonoid glycosyltransferase YjiC (YdhE family)